jgi:hypothetical protein
MLNADFIESLRARPDASTVRVALISVNTRRFFREGMLKALPSPRAHAA